MLDLDQSGSLCQKSDDLAFMDLVWADEDLFDEWTSFSEESEQGDFWNDVFDDELLALK
jgi:hypothetical protein